MRRLLLTVIALALVACGDEPEDRIETIVKFKILAVRAEKPDLRPGDVTRVEVLVGSPSPTSMTTFIIPFTQTVVADYGKGRANFADSGLTFNYLGDSTKPTLPIDIGVPLPAKASPNAGAAFYAAPATPGAYTLGVFVREGAPVVDPALPPAALQAQLQGEMAAALKAFKTVRVVADGEPLNTNPVVTGMEPMKRWRRSEDGRLRGAIGVEGFTLEREQVLRMQPVFTDENVDRASTVWWITGGSIDGYGRNDMDYKAPEKAGIQTVIALVLDRQGGNTWYFQDVAVGVSALAPDAVTTGATRTILAQSGGRMLWLGFGDPASAATVVKALTAQKPVVVEGTPRAEATARLGWYLADPVFVGYADDVTDAMTANDVTGVPRGKVRARLRFDALIRP